MPEYLKALIVILALASIVFAFAKTPACASASTSKDFGRRRNLWFAITLTVFLAHNFWLFIVFATIFLGFMSSREPNRLAMFFLILFAVPPIAVDIGGFSGIRTFFPLDYIRLLALVVLFPAFLSLSGQPDTERFGRSLPDKFLAGYLIFACLLTLSASTVTNTMRGAFLFFIDIFLPYYVASRSLKNLQGFRDALMAFAVAALVLSAIAVFEFARHWLLYSSLRDALNIQWGYGNYLERDSGGNLRAIGSTGHPIVTGYVLTVALGFFLYLRKSAPNFAVWALGLLLLTAGLICAQSRGPWFGAAAMLLAFIATSRSAAINLAKLGLLALLITPVLLLTPAGEAIISRLPLIGTYTDDTIIYRQRLLEIASGVILDNPFFGASNVMLRPEMQDLRQGEGIIDLVNTYIGIGLSYGLVGLSLFCGCFIAVASGIFKSMRSLADRNDELYLLGQALLAVLLGIMITIFTVSSITFIPVVYWATAGLGVAYVRVLARSKDPEKTPETTAPARFNRAVIKYR